MTRVKVTLAVFPRVERLSSDPHASVQTDAARIIGSPDYEVQAFLRRAEPA